MNKLLFGLLATVVMMNGVAMANHHDDHGDDHDDHGEHHLVITHCGGDNK